MDSCGESGPSGGLGDPGFPAPLGRNRRMEDAMAAPTQNEGQVEPPVKRHLGTKCHCYSTPGLDNRPEWPTVPASRFEVWRRAVSYTHLRAHETRHDLVCRLLLEKKKKKK